MKPQVIALPGNEGFADRVATRLGADTCEIATRHFPDGESYVRLVGEVTKGDVILVCTLDRPDDKGRPLTALESYRPAVTCSGSLLTSATA